MDTGRQLPAQLRPLAGCIQSSPNRTVRLPALTLSPLSCESTLQSLHYVEHDFASRPRPQTLEHLVGLSSISEREDLPDAHEEPLCVEEIRVCPKVLGVDIHQNELCRDPALLGELPIGHGD
jgi:hypothetical protein